MRRWVGTWRSVHVILPPNWAAISSGAVSKGCVAVDDAAYQLGERHGFPLRLARDVADAVDERHVGHEEVVGGRLEATSTVAGWPSINASG